MFFSNIFGKKEEKRDVLIVEIESDEEKEEIEFVDNSKSHYFLGKEIHANSIRTLYITNPRDLVEHFKVWSYNRSVNSNHVDNIITSLKNQAQPYFFGSIKMVRDSNGKIEVIDGQHRMIALKNLVTNKDFNMDVLSEVYNVDSVESMNIVTMFHEANNNLNVKNGDLPQLKYVDAITNMKEKYPNNIKNQKSVHYPSITIPNLNQTLLRSGIAQTYDISSEQLLSEILMLNHRYGSMKKHELEKKIPHTLKKKFEKGYEKATKSQFFLGLKGDDWVIDLTTHISKTYKRLS